MSGIIGTISYPVPGLIRSASGSFFGREACLGAGRLRGRLADGLRREIYGVDVYVRGLTEITNYCRNDCNYCGISRSNYSCRRYKLSRGRILECCREGYELGFRTFVLQGAMGLIPWTGSVL